MKEDKAAYFAQYWGQPIQTYKLTYSWKRNIEVSGSSQGFITLKPLSLITDEDAIEVAKIVQQSQIGFEQVKLLLTNYWNSTSCSVTGLQWNAISDFLRSKGYALPFRNYSVEQLIEMRWLTLTNN